MASALRIDISADGLNIEQVIALAQEGNDSKGYSTSVSAIPLTPRSAEACLLEGLDPHDLIERSLESFVEHTSDKEIAKLRFEAYHRTWKIKAKSVRRSYLNILNRPPGRRGSVSGLIIPSPSKASEPSNEIKHVKNGSVDKHDPGSVVTSLAGTTKDSKLLEKFAIMQKREVERMLAEKELMDKLAATQAEHEAALMARAEEEKRLIKERHKAEEAKRLEREKLKLEKEKEEKKRQQELEAATALRAQQIAAAASERKQAQQRERLMKEVARKQKLEEHKRETAGGEARIIAAAEARLAASAAAEELRERQIAKQREAVAARAERARQIARARFEQQQRAAAALQEERLRTQAQRDALQEERAAAAAAKKEEARKSQSEIEAMEARRRELLAEEARRNEENRRHLIEAKAASQSLLLEQQRKTQERVRALKLEQARLEELQRRDAVERAHKREEVRTMGLVASINEREERLQREMEDRRKRNKERREANLKARILKEKLKERLSQPKSLKPDDLSIILGELGIDLNERERRNDFDDQEPLDSVRSSDTKEKSPVKSSPKVQQEPRPQQQEHQHQQKLPQQQRKRHGLRKKTRPHHRNHSQIPHTNSPFMNSGFVVPPLQENAPGPFYMANTNGQPFPTPMSMPMPMQPPQFYQSYTKPNGANTPAVPPPSYGVPMPLPPDHPIAIQMRKMNNGVMPPLVVLPMPMTMPLPLPLPVQAPAPSRTP